MEAALKHHGFSIILDGLTNQPGRMYQPGHLLILDEREQNLVVVIRGTANIRDTLTDLVCEPLHLCEDSFNVGATRATSVHPGIWRAAQTLKSRLQDRVRHILAERPQLRLLVTGHSLGGGVAALLCLLWRHEFGTRVECIAFGPAPTLDDDAARAAEQHGVTSVIPGEDVVPRLSLQSVTHLCDSVIQHAELATTEPVEIRSDHVPLRPAGRLLHLRSHAKYDSAHVVQHQMFERIRVHHMMLLDHLPRSYLHALEQL